MGEKYILKLRDLIQKGSIGNPNYNLQVCQKNGYVVEATIKINGQGLNYFDGENGIAVQVYKNGRSDLDKSTLKNILLNSNEGWQFSFAPERAGTERLKAGLFLSIDIAESKNSIDNEDALLKEHAKVILEVLKEIDSIS